MLSQSDINLLSSYSSLPSKQQWFWGSQGMKVDEEGKNCESVWVEKFSNTESRYRGQGWEEWMLNVVGFFVLLEG